MIVTSDGASGDPPLYPCAMTVHPIRIVGDPVLHNPTTPVERFDEELKALVEDMYDTMAAANGVGLAANQIGVGLRVFVYDCPDDDGVRHRGVVVNPVLSTSEVPEGMPDPDDDYEGCLSVPGETFPTGRASWAKVTGQDLEGAAIEVEGTGFFARCLQHETDHLDGYLYLDRLVGRNQREAKRMLKANKWGVPDLSWDPAVSDDPFA
ncbi:peptide deformylase [Actinokineospora diospyrosa]|uniref:Peptide deformylase n=2 Tax=Actinokineospora diospyrosa TaxID=103728 RepID=A0ABT1IGW5_9PSEU|nr:peptide deformylase [Actinokineospora diospyrosa]